MNKTLTRIGLAVLLLVAIIVLPACKKNMEDARSESTPPPTATTTEVPGMTDNPTDVNPMTAQSWIDDVKTGKMIDAEGKVTDHDMADFKSGDPVYISMKVGDAPAGSAVKAVWLGRDGAKITEETKTVDAPQKVMNFKADTKGWAAGDYSVDIYTGDEKVGSETFILK